MALANKKAVEATLQAWMAGDGNALRSLFHDDITWTITGRSAAAGTTRGWGQLMERVLAPFGGRFAKGERFRPIRINGIYADGDTVIARFEGKGTMNNGQPYENSYVWLLTLRDGRVVDGVAYFDSIAFNELWTVPPATD